MCLFHSNRLISLRSILIGKFKIFIQGFSLNPLINSFKSWRDLFSFYFIKCNCIHSKICRRFFILEQTKSASLFSHLFIQFLFHFFVLFFQNVFHFLIPEHFTIFIKYSWGELIGSRLIFSTFSFLFEIQNLVSRFIIRIYSWLRILKEMGEVISIL